MAGNERDTKRCLQNYSRQEKSQHCIRRLRLLDGAKLRGVRVGFTNDYDFYAGKKDHTEDSSGWLAVYLLPNGFLSGACLSSNFVRFCWVQVVGCQSPRDKIKMEVDFLLEHQGFSAAISCPRAPSTRLFPFGSLRSQHTNRSLMAAARVRRRKLRKNLFEFRVKERRGYTLSHALGRGVSSARTGSCACSCHVIDPLI